MHALITSRLSLIPWQDAFGEDLARLASDHLAHYDPSWTDEQVRQWDGNFRSDGELMLVCSERSVDVEEFRRVLEKHIQFRNQVHPV